MQAVFIAAVSSGIGQVCAQQLCEKGIWVFGGVRDLSKGELLKHQINGKFTPVFIDVTQPNVIHSAVQQVQEILQKENIHFTGYCQ